MITILPKAGPISLVVKLITTSQTFSRATLIQKFEYLKRYPSLSMLSLHVLSPDSRLQTLPNLFLNLARVFGSDTSLVALFPGELDSVPPSNLYKILSASTFSKSSLKPSIVTPVSNLSYPPLSPVVLPRGYPVWCTERFFFLHTRTLDWNNCIWQLRLEEFGQIKHIQVDYSVFVASNVEASNFVVCLSVSPCLQ